MASSKHFSRFLAWTALATISGVVLCVALVVVVDPYRLYRLVDLPGFNRVKPQPERYQKEIKLAGARAVHANVFIVGNSRAEIGFDPDYRDLSAPGLSPYNLALSGRKIQTAREQLDYLQKAGQRPVKLIVGVDFLDFLINPASASVQPALPRPASLADDLKWKFDVLFSMTSVSDAIRTLAIQRATEAETITALGFNPLREYVKIARDDGYYPIFQQRAAEYARKFVSAPHGLIASDSGSSNDFNQLRDILANAGRGQTEVYVVIYPYHAQILAMFEQAGLRSVFEEWKTLLAHQIDAVRAAQPDARIVLWDFSGYSAIQCEAIPAKGDKRSQTKWYWEAGHFKPALGNLMLARMLGQAGLPLANGSIGFRLTSSTLAENRRRFERERTECIASYPMLFRDSVILMEKARRAH